MAVMSGTGTIEENSVCGQDAWTLALADDMRRGRTTPLREFPLAGMTLEARQSRDTLWLIARWPGGGGVAFRTAHAPGGEVPVTAVRGEGRAATFTLESPIGTFSARMETPPSGRALLHWTVTVTPADLLTDPWPTDVYPLDSQGDPTSACGAAHLGQRGLASGFLFFSLTQPRSGSVLCRQYLTALNDLCERVGASPAALVGGQWPRLGYRPPCGGPLPAGEPVVLSDAWVCLSPDVPADERAAGGLFLDLLADLYPFLAPPPTAYNGWPDRARRSLRDLERTADVTTVETGCAPGRRATSSTSAP